MLHDRIMQMRPQLEQQIALLQQNLSSCPTGTLVCCHDKTKCKWYQSNGHTKKLIPKSKASGTSAS